MQAFIVGTRTVVSNFVDGTRIVEQRFRETEADALAHALWLESHGKREEAVEYLDDYLQRHPAPTRH
ncbi:MAG: hypothetical protein Q7R67_00210 [bacterium]|nr:hypothetical protein [bacterium]